MADSVGKISLDLELQGDLNKQLNAISEKIAAQLKAAFGDINFDALGEKIGKSIKNSVDNAMKSMEKTINSSLSNLKGVKIPVSFDNPKSFDMPKQANTASNTSPRAPPMPKVNASINIDAIKAQIDNLAASLDITNAKIEQQQGKLVQLKEAYSRAFNETRKNKLQEQILATEASINRLIGQSDKAGFKLANLDEQFMLLSNSAKNATAGVEAANTKIKETASQSTKASGSINRLNGSMKDSNPHMRSMEYGIQRIAKQFLTWMVILPVIMKGITAMATFLGNALMTNTQFANSLNQIKSNLYTAFMPIYSAILPAINSLMNALTTATAYLASFISQIFGTTYQASFNAAKSMQTQIGALTQTEKQAKKTATSLGKVGSAAKKAGEDFSNSKKGLASFDEINQLSENTSAGAGDGVVTPITPMVDMAPMETKTAEWLDGFKNILSKIFDPMKQAWDETGSSVMNALRTAFDSIWSLLKDIGNTFMSIWTGSLGVEICNNILEILKTIFNIMGQIAAIFKTEWDSGIGKQLVTDIFNLLNSCLTIIKDIANSFSKAWDNNGSTIVNAILLILDDIVGTISDIAGKWTAAWENNGAGDTLANSLLETLGKILSTVGDIGKGIRESLGKAADEIFPVMIQFATKVSDGVGKIADGFKYIWDNGGKHLFDGLVQLVAKVAEFVMKITGGVFEDFGSLFKDVIAPDIAKAAYALDDLVRWLADLIGKINENKPLVEGLKTAFEGLAIAIGGVKLVSFISTLAQIGPAVIGVGETIAAAIGGWPVLLAAAIIAIGIYIYKHWDEIKAKTAEIWNSIGQWISDKWDSIKQWATDKFNEVKEAISNKWEETKTSAVDKWNEIKNSLSEKWESIKTQATDKFNTVKEAVSTKWEETKTNAIDKWDDIKNSLSTKWENVKTRATEKFNLVKEAISDKWEEAKTSATDKWKEISDNLSTKWEEVKETASTKFDAIKSYIAGKWDDVKTDVAPKWDAIKQSLSDKWGEITTKSTDTWDGIKGYMAQKWDDINKDAPGLWDTIKGTLNKKWTEISDSSQGTWNGIVDFVNNVFSGNWNKAWDGIKKIFEDIWNSLPNSVKETINGILAMVQKFINYWNSIKLEVPSVTIPFVGVVKGFTIGVPHIPDVPMLARGGIIDQPTLAMVGEAGKEAVVPLENTSFVDTLASAIANAILAAMQFNNSSNKSNNSQDNRDVILQLDGTVLGRILKPYLDRENNRIGLSVITTD